MGQVSAMSPLESRPQQCGRHQFASHDPATHTPRLDYKKHHHLSWSQSKTTKNMSSSSPVSPIEYNMIMSFSGADLEMMPTSSQNDPNRSSTLSQHDPKMN